MNHRAFQRERGFTLIELIMVIILIGILAVVAVPRLNTSDFQTRGFHDETLALLRYAQKTAIAQRRTVCVAFASDSATLTIADGPATADCAGKALTGPKGESPATVTASSTSIAYSTTPAYVPTGFYFDGLGKPSTGQTIKVANAGDDLVNLTITVEAVTGYVHD
jgi:MSHA pilin protein MshC